MSGTLPLSLVSATVMGHQPCQVPMCQPVTLTLLAVKLLSPSTLLLLWSILSRDSLLVERRALHQKVASSNLGRNSGRIFFSRVNFQCWLLFGVCSIPVLLQWLLKDPSSARSASCRLQLNMHTHMTQRSVSGLALIWCPFHPCVTAVAYKGPQSFCQKCRWQVITKCVYTLDPMKSEWADYAAVQTQYWN